MYRLFYAERDATIYERFTELNTGVDQILELIKLSSASADFSDTFNTRILIDFGSEINTLRTAVNNGKIPPLGNAANSASVYLKMYAAESEDLLRSYNLKAYLKFSCKN